jgi:predicted secreted protein
MSPIFAVAIYFILWWLVLFVVLPVGVQTQEEEGNVAPGTTASAPAKARIFAKLAVTTLLSGLIFAALYGAWEFELLALDSIPFLPEFESQGGLQ